MPAGLDRDLPRVDMHFAIGVRVVVTSSSGGVPREEPALRREAGDEQITQSARPEGWGGASQGRVMADMASES